MGSFSVEAQTEVTLLDQVALLGRKSELRQFIKSLTLCRSGQGKAIFLSGNEGIGKSSILETFLDLAQNAYGCRSVSVSLSGRPNAHLLFSQIVKEILGLANQTIHQSLQASNQILQPLGVYWSQGDLIRIVALIRLQESVNTSQSMAIEQISDAIYGAMPFFKRFNTSVKEQIDALAEILADPWLTLSVSLANPINPQVQKALGMVEQILGTPQNQMRLLSSTLPDMPLISPVSDTSQEALEQAGPSRLVTQNEGAQNADVVEIENNTSLPSFESLQTALNSLMSFINQGLQAHQSAFILVFDQWEALFNASFGEIKVINDLFGEMIRQTVDQRNSHMMVVVSCRSESESYVVGGGLYNTLRVKYLVPPLNAVSQQRFLKDTFKTLQIETDDEVIQEILRICQGNPSWLTLMTKVIASDTSPSELKVLDWDTYQERYSVSQPKDILEILYTRLQLAFVGQEDLFLKVLTPLVLQSNTVFKRGEVLNLLGAIEDGAHVAERLLTELSRYGFLVAETRENSEPCYSFYSSFLFNFLKEKVRPIQDDIPTADKVASLKKILPLSIQSGELTKEKTQELLAMASAMENPELTQFVEQTLVDALQQGDLGVDTKITLLESLSLIYTAASIEAILGMLEDSNASLRECACIQLIPLAHERGLPIAGKTLVDAILPLIQDPVVSVKVQVYQFLAKCVFENARVVPVLMEGVVNENPQLRLLSLTGLLQRRLKTPETLKIYHRTLEQETDDNLLKVALRGLQLFDKDTVEPILKAYLENHTESSFWKEVLMQLMHLDLRKTLPWLSKILAEGDDLELKLFILKRFGAKPHPEVEKLLINILKSESSQGLEPELRWMTIRSLGWIGQSQEALITLETQQSVCQNDEILSQALKSAIRQVSERVLPIVDPPRNGQHSNGGKHLLPSESSSSSNLNGRDISEVQRSHQLIDLVAVSSDS